MILYIFILKILMNMILKKNATEFTSIKNAIKITNLEFH